ncbi:ABC transporter permease [Mesorhizobium sp. SP-1A]|uniref:ABC transporter permease n=1 Tax=Mesorhizobium sp. SP-1A TaxID=3077840 RepID=UPI0028F6F7B1|nr:ABC transporter permease [Mesorhizobium sp. SP-1A]
MSRFIERRLVPADSLCAVLVTTGLSVLLALVIGGLLFLPFGTNPLHAYGALFEAGFATWRGFGFTLVKAAPLILIGLGTICAWRTGFAYLGFEGCLLMGAATATWVALQTVEGGLFGPLPFAVFLPLAVLVALLTGAVWAGIVGFFKSRFGGNEVITSLMMNYIAIFLVQYLVSGPLRAKGELPASPRLPQETWLPMILDGTRAHAGILIAVFAAVAVWLLLLRSRVGYELVVTGLNSKAARYGGINVGSRQLIAAFLAGGLASLAGMVEVLGVHHRLVDGLSEGTGFIGIVTALLGKLHPAGAVIAALLYAGMSVGADAMQRQAGLPASVIFIVQSLIVLFILASDMLRHFALVLPWPRCKTRRVAAAETGAE